MNKYIARHNSTFQMKPTLPIYVLQGLQGHLSVVQNFIFYLNIPNEFALLMSLGINPNILGASEDILSVSKCTVRFLRLCSSWSFLKLYGFCIKWKVYFLILCPKSFFCLIDFCRKDLLILLVNAHWFVPFW